jgi:hypothetical protein
MADEQAAAQPRDDQAAADADTEVDRLVAVLRNRITAAGERQAAVDLAHMISLLPPDDRGGILAAAIIRLAG